MRFNPPRSITWFISLGLIVLGIVARVMALPVLAKYDFWLVVLGGVILLLGTLLTNL
jgi:predicted membrane channel-forming protein YqfA (hemolysin III family)